MTTGSKKRSAGVPRRRAGNLYERLEEAREKRARILATPKPANKPTAVKTKVHPTRVIPQEDTTARDRLPRLKPAEVKEDPKPEVAELRRRLRRKPIKRTPWLTWHAGLVVTLFAMIFALTVLPENAVPFSASVSTESHSTLTPPIPSPGRVVLPDGEGPPSAKPVAGLALTQPDTAPAPLGVLPPLPETRIETSLTQTVASPERPKQNPRSDVVVERALPPELELTTPVENIAPPPVQPLELRPAVNLPRTISNTATQAIAARLDGLDLDWGDFRYFDFNVNQTQVRYYHAVDKEDAAVLADAFGATLRDFTDFEPSPPEGRVELWIAGRAGEQRQQDPISGVRQDLQQLGSNLQNTLRSITQNR